MKHRFDDDDDEWDEFDSNSNRKSKYDKYNSNNYSDRHNNRNIHGRATKRSRLNQRAKAEKEYEYHKQIIRELQDQYQFESSENNNERNKREFKDELGDIEQCFTFTQITIKIISE